MLIGPYLGVNHVRGVLQQSHPLPTLTLAHLEQPLLVKHQEGRADQLNFMKKKDSEANYINESMPFQC